MDEIENEKAQEYLQDATSDYLSECCAAPIVGGFCKNCKEPAEGLREAPIDPDRTERDYDRDFEKGEE